MTKTLQYDFIIVGAGPAGCVLANRLTENTSINVLLIEAGGSDNRFIIKMPAAFAMAARRKDLDWHYSTEPEEKLGGRKILEHRGRVIGGSSSINGMVANRGNQMDYDGWAKDGLKDWSFEKCLPYFKKSETFDGGSSSWRGRSGPQSIEVARADHPLNRAYLSAGKESGYGFTEDQNGENQEGFHIAQSFTKNGSRFSAADAYLKPIIKRTNLFIETNCMANRIEFDGNRAVKIIAEKKGKILEFEATREIIISCGAINTPQLLLLSGVGDPTHLRQFDIQKIADVPAVGRNLENHVIAPIIYGSPSGVSLAEKLNGWRKYKVGIQWLLFKRGIGASTMCEAGSFFRSSSSADYVDLQHEFYPLSSLISGDKSNFGGGFMFSMGLMRPKSKGKVLLKSRDPKKHPEIRYNFFLDSFDEEVMIKGVKKTRSIASQSAFSALRTEELSPGPSVKSNKEISNWLRSTVSTEYHPCSSCRMGFDENSVTDQKGKVYETEGLRIVDASIMRSNVTANLNAPVLMIAEKIADHIKNKNR